MSKKSTSIIVTITDEKLQDIEQVADELKDKGMKVDNVMPITGVISGSCTSGKLSALKKVDGVMSVEKEAVAYLPPPDSPTQ